MNRVEGVLFVPHTPGGVLARKIQSADDIFSRLHDVPRVKIVERGGSKLMDQLGKKDPWANTSCNKSDCMICQSKCKKKGT